MTIEHRNAMHNIVAARGKSVIIKGEKRQIIDVRVTFGAGMCLTLDRPLSGKSSSLFNISANEADKAIEIAASLS